MVLIKPSVAPKAVLALKKHYLRAQLSEGIDELQFLAWQSLEGSVRFKGALEAIEVAKCA